MYRSKALPKSLSLYLYTFITANFLISIVTYVRINYLGANLLLGQLTTSSDKSGVIPQGAYSSGPYTFGVHYFSDFLEPLLKTQARAPYSHLPNGLEVSNYPPLGQAILFPFSWTPYRPTVVIFLASMLIALLSAFWYVTKDLKRRDLLLFLTVGVAGSTPVLFLLDRGNLWGFTTALCLWAIIAGINGNWKAAGICISIAACLKVFPIVLLIWVYRRSGVRSLVPGIISGLVATLGSMMLFKGSIIGNFMAFIKSQAPVHSNLSGDPSYHPFNNSLLGLLGNIQGSSFSLISSIGRVLLVNYIVVVFCLLVVSVLAILNNPRNDSRSLVELTLLITLITLLPPAVFGYALSLFLLPLLLILRSGLDQDDSDLICVVIALMFVNKIALAPYGAFQTGSNLCNSSLNLLLLVICLRRLLQGVEYST